jgi:hypothetical protein
MSTETTGHRNATTPSDPAQLRAEISRTRSDLGETAAALAARADVRARVRTRAADLAGTVRRRVTTTAGQVRYADPAELVRRPVPVAIIAAVVSATTVTTVLIRRGRH